MRLKETLFRLSRKKGLVFAGKAAYSLWARLVSLYFRITPEIRSVYLAGSMSGGDIIPGLSDIDFVIVVRGLDSKNEYEFLKNLEEKLRYMLPPFGKDKIGTHVIVYTAGEWAILGDIFQGKKSGSPLALFDKDVITFTNRFGPALKALHHYYKAHWRLEMIEQNIVDPPINDYELRLKERLLERCLRSILNGIEENDLNTNHSNLLSESKHEIEELLRKSAELGSDGLHPAILSRLLHFFDLATNGNVFPGEYLYESMGINEKPSTTEENGNADKDRLNRVQDISILLRDEIISCPVFYCRNNNTDYFIYDLSRYHITEILIGHYRRNNELSFRILSKSRCDNLYFVFQESSARFTCLGDNKQYLLKVGLDDDRIILESYTLFPQLRSLINSRDPIRYKAFHEKARKLISLIESRIPSGGRHTASTKEEVRDLESSRYDGSEYERFTNLREISDILRDKINSFLESNNNSMRASRTTHAGTSVPGGLPPE